MKHGVATSEPDVDIEEKTGTATRTMHNISVKNLFIIATSIKN